MDARRWQSPAAAAAAVEAAEEDGGGGGGGGTGGPSRRPLRRGLHRAAPYGLGPRRWLPKLPVASRIFPATSRDRAASDNNQEDQQESREIIHENHFAEPNTSVAASGLPVNSKSNLLLEDDPRNQSDSGIAEIEKMIKQRIFSRDETERLVELMRSRTPDFSVFSVEDERAPGSIAKGFEATSFAETLLTPKKPIYPQSTLGTDIFASSNVHDAGSSPIEIAKAYMEAQNSASIQESQKRKFRALSHGVEIENSTSKTFPKVATIDSSVCWPGSVVRDYPNYLTPKSNKGRTLPQPLSRTPYGGSVFQRSIKNTRHGDARNSSGQPQLSTPFSVGSKEDQMTSASGFRVQPLSSSRGGQMGTFGATTPLFPREGSAPTRKVTFNLDGPLEKGTIESSSAHGHVSAIDNMTASASVSVHPKSSETAFKILQQLEKAIPSPTAKPLGLRQTPVKRTASSVVTSSQFKGPDYNISNVHRHSNTSEGGSSYKETSDAKKAPPPNSHPNAEELSPKIQNRKATSEVPDKLSSQHPLKPHLTSTSATCVLDNNTSRGFTFTFPVSTSSSSFSEPPPTPTLAPSPARNLPTIADDIPKFTFGSSSSTNLVFNFDSTTSSVVDETAPSFTFGSDKKRELCFDVAGKDAVCF